MTEKPVSTQLLGLEVYPLRTNTRFQGPPGFNSSVITLNMAQPVATWSDSGSKY